MIFRSGWLAVILFFSCVICAAQENQSGLTLEDIFSHGSYKAAGFGPVRWMKDNRGYSTLETAAGNLGREIVRYDAATGARTVLVSSAQLTPSGAKTPLTIGNYSWSSDNRYLLVFTNTRKVWRYHTRGDYWVLDLEKGSLKRLGLSLPESTLMFAKFSPDNSRVAYVSELNIFVEDITTGKITQLTSDGGNSIINGTFDWVYEEELDCRDGFRWSPDGTKIAYWQSDTKAIGTYYLINNVDSLYSKPIPLPYPKVGAELSAVKIGVVPANGGNTSWFNIPGDPTNNYLARMEFIPASNEVLIQQLNRLQNTNKVWKASVTTMKAENILTEKDAAFLDLHDNTIWLNNQQTFTWTSDRDGWLHLYSVSRNGKNVKRITKGQFDIVSVKCIDEKGGYVYYIASPDNFTERYLYRSRLDGKGLAERVTPADQPGQHDYQMSADANWAIHIFQNTTTPPQYSLVRLKNHLQVKVLEDNSELKQRIAKLNITPKRFFKVAAGEHMLDAFIIKPANFDSTRKYPLVFYIYGEPAGSTVQNNWDGGEGLWHQYLAGKQYIIISIDNRGTKTPRGNQWRKSIYGKIGIIATEDQHNAARNVFRMFPFIDTARVGIWGWSGGGQMTLNCMFKHPDIYKTGIAVSFVSDQRLYDATYQERYMGLLSENASGYYNGSPINFVNNLKGNLMIIHGTADDNVHYQSFEMLANELIRNNKLFTMMSYPMRAHGINERENTSLHLRRTMEKFWRENL